MQWNWLRRLYWAWVLLAFAGGGVCAAIPSNLQITNQATTGFLDISGQPQTTQSLAVVVSLLDQADLAVSKTAPSSVTASSQFSYTITVTNGGPATAVSLVMTDSLPANVAFISTTGGGATNASLTNVVWVVPSLASGASMNFGLTVLAPASGVMSNSVVVGSATPDPNLGNNSAGPILTTVNGGPSPTLTKSANATNIVAGGQVQFTLVAGNTGTTNAAAIPVFVNSAATALVIIRDVIPQQTRFIQFNSTGAGTPLYHQSGDPQQSYSSTAPADLTQVDAIAVGYPTLPVGAAPTVTFTVLVGSNATGSIINSAQLDYAKFPGGASQQFDSNLVTLNLTTQLPPPTINYYSDNTYTRTAVVSRAGADLFVQARCLSCITDPTKIETNTITITSLLTGDSETYLAVETGPGTGLFQILPSVKTALAATTPGTPNDHILQTRPDDVLTATINGGAVHAIATTQIMIDPSGVVFDSHNNQPIAGATVTLIDVTGQGNHQGPNQPAFVFANDGVTRTPATITTGPDGAFQYLLVPESTYKLVVTPPKGYTFPSQVPSSALPAGRVIDPSASYGGTFIVSSAIGTVRADVPVDPPPSTGGLLIEKTVSTPEAEVGDLVTYTVQIKNLSSNAVAGVTLADTLPLGFTYQRHSAATNGVAILDPAGGKGPQLKFMIGSLASGGAVTLTYRTSIGVGALQGTGLNHAQASAIGPPSLKSNLSVAAVKVAPGVFTDQAYIIGKVFVDLNHNLIQDDGEPGVPGVRIYMENGTYVVTDSEGKYSIYGLSPRTHVLKVDEITLPPGARLEALTPRHDSRGLTCLADLKRGEMRKVNFAIASTTSPILAEVRRRREAEGGVAEIQQALTHELVTGTTPLATSGGTVPPAAGMTSAVQLPVAVKSASEPVTAAASPVYQSMIDTVPLNSRNSLLPARPVAVVPRIDLEEALRDVTGELGFVDLRDHDTLPIAIANVRVKGPVGVKFVLKLNGRRVSEQQVGKRVEVPARHLAGWEYIGIALQPGQNLLEVQQTDPFGNVHSAKITVTAPGDLGTIKIILPKGDQSADGMTPVKVVVVVQDDKGVPVTARTLVTLDSSLGRWQVPDLNPDEPGVQTYIENGAAEFTLLPPQEPGDAKIIVSSGILRETAVLPFLPSLRPMLVAGLIEGRLNLRNLNLNHILVASSSDGFEQELRNWSFGSAGGEVEGGGRVAMFLKGKIKGDYLLTLAYDSDKTSQTALFRDIQPDAFYPVYGDSGGRGFDAQSTGRLYIRVDKRKSYLLYGDFPTGSAGEARSLGNYSRSLTGLKEHYEKANIIANAWGAFDSMKQIVQEFPGQGISGPYFFKISNGVENSEKVEIITRDRNQTNLVLKVVPMQRFVDYEFEPFSGMLLFSAPVPSIDSNLNPISIRVTFEVDQGGQKFFVGGADAQVKLLPRWEVGGSVVDDENPTKRYQLYSANTTVKLFTNTFMLAELAQSNSSTNGVGSAGRLELRHETPATSVRMYGAYVETNYDNPTSLVNAGRQEVGAKLSQKLDKQTRLLLDVIDTKQLGTSNELWGVVGGVEHTFANKISVEVGGRYSEETVGSATTNSVTSVRTRVSMPVPMKPEARLTGEYENDVLHPDRRLADIGLEYQTATRSRFYAKHEFINSVGSAYELSSMQQHNSTVVGVETEYMKEGNLFNEYRMNDGISGPDAVAAIGTRNGWNVAPGIKLNTTLERTAPIVGTNTVAVATAMGLGLDYTRDPNWKATGRIEYRTSDTSDHWLNTLGYARKLDEDWTLLAKSILDTETDKGVGAGDKFQSRLQLGTAYRETRTDVWSGLFLYEYKYQDTTGTGSNDLRSVHIFTSHLNYQPSAELTLNGRLAFKFVNEDAAGIKNNNLAYLVGGRGMFNLTRRWSIGANANAMFSGDFRSVQYGLGPDIGVRIHDNIWLDAGYNFIGFHDQDLSGGNYTEHGFFLGLRMQFDEHVLDALKRTNP